MTVVLEPPTSVQAIQAGAAGFNALTSWLGAAVRTHAILSQTMPDDELDELVDAAGQLDPLILRAVSFG